jgi:4-carboxymuconolactone decarboxylase
MKSSTRKTLSSLAVVTAIAGLMLSGALQSWAQDGVRFPDIPRDKMTAEQQKFAASIEKSPRNSHVTNMPYKVYVRSPEYANLSASMSDYLRWGTSLSRQQAELVILLAARYWSAGYVWRQHYVIAMKEGMDPQIPAAIAVGKRPEGMKEDDALIYDLITQLYRDHDVAQSTYDSIVARFGEKGVVDAIALAGYYGITAFATFTAKTPFEPGNEPKLVPLAKPF